MSKNNEQIAPNQTYLKTTEFNDDQLETMIEVSHVSMIFNMATEQLHSLKEYAISIARRKLSFKEFRALDDVSLTVKRGDVFGVMGTNGSGKSTLLKIIAGVLDPTKGTCEVNGTIAPLIELGAGFDIELTARENIYLNGALLGYSKEFINEHFDEIVNFAEIRPFLDMPLKNYSSGMVARIAFAIATVIIPDVLIVDEVLSVGDFMFQQKCERRIRSLIRDHGVTVLIVSHNSDQVERLCNKAIWIEKGHTRMIGTAEEVCEIYRSIGGRAGSEESESLVYNVMNSPIAPDEESVQVISGKDRYDIASQLFEQSFPLSKKTSVVIASGEDASSSLLANALAGSLESALLLVKHGSIPEEALNTLESTQASELFVVGSDPFVSEGVVKELALHTEATINIVAGNTLQELTLSVYRAGIDYGSGWGDTAVITYDGCIGDVVSLMPFIYANKAPLFFSVANNQLTEEVSDLFATKQFNRLISLGGLSFDLIDHYKEQSFEVTRIVGSSLADASRMINEWQTEQGLAPKDEVVVASVWGLHDVLSIGAYLGLRGAFIWLEDSQSLDSIANILGFVQDHAAHLDQVTFIGDDTRSNKNDQQLIAKALKAAR
ncbi:ATP-binding cassette domain-containing protein [Anaerotardibacter muris]|uniref:ATP-binding cassette domain-containing protein n=1 Tax=Anaerotardibacter muris TaxID=2941505 RepID=UPI0020416CA9|nr:ATP-binding cassette domain-containing protein [Anaerotardibacter muris]